MAIDRVAIDREAEWLSGSCSHLECVPFEQTLSDKLPFAGITLVRFKRCTLSLLSGERKHPQLSYGGLKQEGGGGKGALG